MKRNVMLLHERRESFMIEALKRFFEKLAKANEKEFSGQNPDCCTINRPEQVPKNTQYHNSERD